MTTVSIVANISLSLIGCVITKCVITEYIPIFIQRKMFGKDQCKAQSAEIPEPIGVIAAAVYLVILFIFIPFPLYEWSQSESLILREKFLMFLSALTAVCSAVLLGFADDVLDLRWRHKLIFPTLSSLPLLLVYYSCGSSTTVVIPSSVSALLDINRTIDIGIFYFMYMGLMIVFCTNAINILAGINGLEAGQALIIASSVSIFNVVQLFRLESQTWHHLLSLYFLLPFIGTSAVLLFYNWYPASVFVGDTFCYWAGMTLASTCIIGHFSKTMMLFLIPQVFNFLYSTPQLFKLIPCPRHRLPKFDCQTNTVGMSFAEFKIAELNKYGIMILKLLSTFGLVYCEFFVKDSEKWVKMSNLTLINLTLKVAGPMHERNLTIVLLLIQIICSCCAFFVRFYIAHLVYTDVQ